MNEDQNPIFHAHRGKPWTATILGHVKQPSEGNNLSSRVRLNKPPSQDHEFVLHLRSCHAESSTPVAKPSSMPSKTLSSTMSTLHRCDPKGPLFAPWNCKTISHNAIEGCSLVPYLCLPYTHEAVPHPLELALLRFEPHEIS